MPLTLELGLCAGAGLALEFAVLTLRLRPRARSAADSALTRFFARLWLIIRGAAAAVCLLGAGAGTAEAIEGIWSGMTLSTISDGLKALIAAGGLLVIFGDLLVLTESAEYLRRNFEWRSTER